MTEGEDKAVLVHVVKVYGGVEGHIEDEAEWVQEQV
jgi:hypothetical protein